MNKLSTQVASPPRKSRPTVSAEEAAKVVESLLKSVAPAKRHFSLAACARFARAETLVRELRGLA